MSGESKKAKCQGGPWDGFTIRVFPDPEISKSGKLWHWNDILVSDGGYEIGDDFDIEKKPILYWKDGLKGASE